jgi:PRTRC genetic system protein A
VKPVGYLLNEGEGLTGEPGLFYDYIEAGNGLFIHARNPLIEATICIGPVKIRGLSPLENQLELVHGKIPRSLYDLSLSILMSDSELERYLAITWEEEYRLMTPHQERSAGSVKYDRLPSRVMDIHSHVNVYASFVDFSGIDNDDEQGLRLYMVVGRLDTLLPEVQLRLGVYGYFAPLDIDEVFDV